MRILIADDDAEVREGAAELLSQALGLGVALAESGEQALEILRQRAVHVALLDLHMPGRGGLEVFEAMRRDALLVPCILWSGDATEAIESTALRSGVSAFLRKPVEPVLLRGEVRRVLESHWGAAP